MKFLFTYFITLLLVSNVFADEMSESIPHVSKKAQQSYQYNYAYANMNRAFAIAPGGAWAWSAGGEKIEDAKRSALEKCNSFTEQTCILYALNNERVFDRLQWNSLWRPYKTEQQLINTEVGIKRGEIFPNLEYKDLFGNAKSIHELKGKVVFVHFWACWCPSCQYEFESLTDFYRIVKDTMGDSVEFVILQAREPIELSLAWAKKNNFDILPLSDSGVKSEEDDEFYLKGGKRIKDRKIAKVFPSSYVLDKHGVVAFAHMGSIDDWTEYVAFIKDVEMNSGK